MLSDFRVESFDTTQVPLDSVHFLLSRMPAGDMNAEYLPPNVGRTGEKPPVDRVVNRHGKPPVCRRFFADFSRKLYRSLVGNFFTTLSTLLDSG